MTGGLIGRPVDRVDGHDKVTGAATYAADQRIPGLLHGFLVLSTIARGRITGIEVTAAERAPGVLRVFTHHTMPRLTMPVGPYRKGYLPVQDDRIHHNGQPIALVVAHTLEQAQHAASLVSAQYQTEKHRSALHEAEGEEFVPPVQSGTPNETIRGNPAAGLAEADIRIEGIYSSPIHLHNPMEPSATIAHWTGGQVTVYESTQSVTFARSAVSQALRVPLADVKVVSPYLGGGFGAKGATWPHTLLTAAAARELDRPVKLVLSRAQLYTAHGHRSELSQRITLGAKRDGRLTALVHVSTQQVSATEDRVYNSSHSSRLLYAVPNLHVRQQAVRLDLQNGSFIRSPELAAHHGLETALDELSHRLGIDPVELRLRNYAATNPETGARWGSKHLDECYRIGARAFGWSQRDPRIGSMRDGDIRIGWGMATEAHTCGAMPSGAHLSVGVDGRATLSTGAQDIGTGTYTVLTQVAAQVLGLPLSEVTTRLGHTDYPVAMGSFGSGTVNSVTGAVDQAAGAVRAEVIRLAVTDPRSPLHGMRPEDIVTEHGYLFAKDRRRRDSYRDVLTRHGKAVESTGSSANTPNYTTGAVFVEVRVDPRYGKVTVSRVVGAYDPGRVLNRRTAHSQAIGGAIWGIGFALMEHAVVDPAHARIMNATLSTYLMPVNADVPEIETHFVDEPDPTSAALGARGFGETPMTGVPAAIGNAVFHATGRRIRDLPITQDKLL
ncbi:MULTISPECIES: xanthine dehydrogenase family protein molybdopterin-binding subunit [unclassified Crossiella]|uniref:xanthine dehydrogenase family protein molybdopterin-binding subunit n=1 Tax=unclassified Crossiella TaxID=2620835 RepID=UPI001FFF6B94|nr:MULTISPECIES: xanthine dehydrogenase family protein molybdopterin-binding subunit [unclassified Crossiella]MCK2239631.1 xanthine dehydrogenase family protein molybdopterin-binding subunit [Crossiella sp. S99.2]MCK2252326.1 xanthine dehydrogenase family protein molybdopterin-binding subunit [Crossiella sp. S99.1]